MYRINRQTNTIKCQIEDIICTKYQTKKNNSVHFAVIAMIMLLLTPLNEFIVKVQLSFFVCIDAIAASNPGYSTTIYGKTFEVENFCGCAQNTLFTRKLLQCIRPWPSCTVYSK